MSCLCFHNSRTRTLVSFYNAFLVLPFLMTSTLVLSYLCILAGILCGNKAANKVAIFWGRLCCAVIPIHVRISGKSNYYTNQNYVVVSNHQSMADIPIIQGFLGLNIKWVIKKELERFPVFGTACQKLGCIFVDRKNRTAAIESIQAGKNTLGPFDSVFFFPEGTRSKNGQVLPFKKGAFFFAAEANLPILPITIINTCKVLPRGSLNIRPGRIVDIIIHPPVNIPSDERGKNQIEKIMENVRTTIISNPE